MSVSIVMPCYNEEAVIEEVVRSYYREVISRLDDSEYIIVDDHSTDRSCEILERLKMELPALTVLRTPYNSGHGRALRLGYDRAVKDFIFQVDSDNQFEVNDFWKLYGLKDSYDLIVGFRRERQDLWPRLLLAKIVRLVDFFLFGLWINDANCPFRLINRRPLRQLLAFIDPEALAPNIMISVLAKNRKMRIAEVPVTHRKRMTGKASIMGLGLIGFSLRGLRQLVVLRKRL